MSNDNDNSKLINENIVLKEKLDKVEAQNAELTKQNGELIMQNGELSKQNTKLMEEIEAMKAEKFHNNSTESTDPNSQKMLEKKSTDSAEEKIDGKRAKLTGRRVSYWLVDSLEWIARKELADSKLSTSCETFKHLCWPKLHGKNVKPYKVDELSFRKEWNGSTGIYQAKQERYNLREFKIDNLQIASIPPPDYIIGFERITIYFLDYQIMRFIECIHSKLNAIFFEIGDIKIPIWQCIENFSQIHRLWEMLAPKALSISCNNISDIVQFYTKSNVLFENIQLISTWSCFNKNENDDLLIQWLNKSRTDQRPKLIKCRYCGNARPILIDKIKEQFIASTQSANFLVAFDEEWEPTDYANFNLENEQTGEMLSLYPNLNANQYFWIQHYHYPQVKRFLIRHPKCQEHLRADWEEQYRQLTDLPKVHIDITGIGEF